MKIYHYVYKITNHFPKDSKKYYIGVRTCKNCKPEEDIEYNGSSKYLKEAIKEIGIEYFSKEILSVWKTRKLALKEEIRLHNKFEVGSNKEFYNRSKQTSIGFYITGYKHSKSDEGKKNIQKAQRKIDRTKENNSFFGKTHSKKSMKQMVNNRIKNNGVYHPKGNHTAKTFLFISPEGKEFIIFNGAKKFSESKNINFKLIRKCNGEKYTLSKHARNVTDATQNSVGWSVTEIKYN